MIHCLMRNILNKSDHSDQFAGNNPVSAAGLLLGGLLILLAITIAVLSFQPGTWLSGWDTLHPEFNFQLAVKRQFFGIFRAEQGLGAVAAHSHMADLPRVILLAIFSLILPAYNLRYFFIGICLVAGVVGMFVFTKRVLLNSGQYSSVFAFLGGLFYLLNLGTLQQFYVPFEMFTVQYAALPWLFYFATRYLLKPERKSLALFALVTLLATPMAFASTLWFAYFLVLISYLGFFARRNFSKIAKLVILTLAINSFWLLPAGYFVLSGNAASVPLAKANKIFSQEAFVYNKSFGTVADVLILRNFLLDWLVYDYQKESFGYLMNNWREHLARPEILLVGYFLSAVAVAGIIFGVWGRNQPSLALILPTVLAVVFLINQNPPFDFLFGLLREKIPLFEEAMRFPFTKFSLILIFIMSCFFALGQKMLYMAALRISRFKLSLLLIFMQLAVFTSLLFLYMKPALTGDFISKKIQVDIPKEYFEVFDWFNTQPDGRVATFPVNSFWGWTYYKWGFQGAQFISFGVKQPLMDRDYDRWNKGNEEYLRQISYAIYSRNLAVLEKVLSKYHISYLMLDRNIIAPGQDKKALFNDEIESLFASSSQIRLVKDFGNISIYRFSLIPDSDQFVSGAKNFINIKEDLGPQDLDQIYLSFGDYLISKQNIPALSTPFNQLMDNQNILNLEKLPVNTFFPLDSYFQSKLPLPTALYAKRDSRGLMIKLVPKIVPSQDYEKGLSYEITIPPDAGNLQINLDNYQSIPVDTELQDNFSDQGTIFLSTDTLNNLAVYRQVEEGDQIDWDISAFVDDQGVPLCSLLNNRGVRAKILDSKGVSLAAENTRGCISIPFKQVLTANQLESYKSLARFSFNTVSSASFLGHWCIFDSGLGRCLKEQEFLSSGSTSDFILVDPVNINRLQLILFVDALSGTQEVSYSDITFNINNPVGLLTVSPSDLQNTLKDYHRSHIPAGVLFSDSFNLVEYDRKSRFCDHSLGELRLVNLSQGVIEYNSESLASCDYFAFPNLPHNLGFVVRLDSENVAGLPLRMCVANPLSRRCELFAALPESKSFVSQFFLLPPINDGGVGYNIHFTSYTTGKITSVNRIKELKILPFPYAWFSQIGIDANNTTLIQSSKAKIDSVKQFFPGAIAVNYSSEGESLGLLTLNHSFDQGWWGSSGEHVKVNGWANGWLVSGKDQTLLIFYWPQLLQVAGFGLVAASFVWSLKYYE